MNVKRFTAASIAVFIINQITDPIIHGAILGKTYEALEHVWRPDMMSKMWVMVISSIIFAFLFVYIFTKGYEGKGVIEGIRYGIFIGLLFKAVGLLSQYAIYPVPFSLVIQWFAFGMIQFIIYGIVTALVYKPKTDQQP